MSVRKYSFLFPLIVFVALLFFSSITNEASPDLQQEVPEQIPINLDDIKVGPGVDEPDVKRDNLAAKISDDYKELCLECAHCYSICEYNAIDFHFPKGGTGIIYKRG